MLYDRKIKYVDYYENGERVKGGGFVKLEVRDGVLKMELNIRGLHPTDSFVRDVVVSGSETEAVLGQIALQGGSGSFVYSCQTAEGIGSTEIPYEELQEIKIPVGGSRELRCIWGRSVNKTVDHADPLEAIGGTTKMSAPEVREIRAQGDESLGAVSIIMEDSETAALSAVIQEMKVQEAAIREPEVQEAAVQEAEVQETATQETEVQQAEVQQAAVQETVAQEAAAQEADVQETVVQKAKVQKTEALDIRTVETGRQLAQTCETVFPKTGYRETDQKETELQGAELTQAEPVDKNRSEEKPAVKLLEDKWQQLSAIYPHIRPFKDDRDYLSLSPSDFVMFPESYYRAANNSFLLHGFYNYKHLILARVERRGEARYYLGVPGNYYEREKQVAVMFGFESFECDREPAKTGDFGYYMMRMEL